jgi:hypothetical protein
MLDGNLKEVVKPGISRQMPPFTKENLVRMDVHSLNIETGTAFNYLPKSILAILTQKGGLCHNWIS